jgi:hypothetical protein
VTSKTWKDFTPAVAKLTISTVIYRVLYTLLIYMPDLIVDGYGSGGLSIDL